MNHDIQTKRDGKVQLHAKSFGLGGSVGSVHYGRFQVLGDLRLQHSHRGSCRELTAWQIVIVQTGLADRRDLRMLCQAAQLRKKVFHLVLDICRMNADDGMNSLVLFGQRHGSPAAFNSRPNGNDPRNAGLRRPPNHSSRSSEKSG